jgi:hypothetical protein
MNRNSASGIAHTCFNCKKKGHKEIDCPNKNGQNSDHGNGDKNRSKSASQNWNDRPGREPLSDEEMFDLKKKCQIKNTDLEGMVTKLSKEFVYILVQEHFKFGQRKMYGPEPCVIKYRVDDYIRVSSEEKLSKHNDSVASASQNFFFWWGVSFAFCF